MLIECVYQTIYMFLKLTLTIYNQIIKVLKRKRCSKQTKNQSWPSHTSIVCRPDVRKINRSGFLYISITGYLLKKNKKTISLYIYNLANFSTWLKRYDLDPLRLEIRHHQLGWTAHLCWTMWAGSNRRLPKTRWRTKPPIRLVIFLKHHHMDMVKDKEKNHELRTKKTTSVAFSGNSNELLIWVSLLFDILSASQSTSWTKPI